LVIVNTRCGGLRSRPEDDERNAFKAFLNDGPAPTQRALRPASRRLRLPNGSLKALLDPGTEPSSERPNPVTRTFDIFVLSSTLCIYSFALRPNATGQRTLPADMHVAAKLARPRNRSFFCQAISSVQCSFAVAARSPSSFHSNLQPAVSQPVQVHT
jgi:hypothetical protein